MTLIPRWLVLVSALTAGCVVNVQSTTVARPQAVDHVAPQGNWTLTRVSCLGFDNCQQISNGDVRLTVTTDVGPRIAEYALVEGSNVLGEMRKAGAPPPDPNRFSLFGGHRFALAPESPLTYGSDSVPVQWSQPQPDTLVLSAPVDAKTGTQKELRITLDAKGSGVYIQHILTNRGPTPAVFAPWGITVMVPGGTGIVPQEPFVAHGQNNLPVRSMALWSYTDLSDGRVSLGKQLVRIASRTDAPALKLGFENTPGWAAYHHGEMLFVKRFAYAPDVQYTDRGSNCEVFTRGEFMEIEALGPLSTIPPGATVDYVERWYLFSGVSLPSDEQGAQEAVLPLISGTQAVR